MMGSHHRPLAYEANELTTAPICNGWGARIRTEVIAFRERHIEPLYDSPIVFGWGGENRTPIQWFKAICPTTGRHLNMII